MEKMPGAEEANLREKIEAALGKLRLNLVNDKPEYNREVFAKTREVSVEAMKTFFEGNNYIIREPIPLVLPAGTTLFVSAGIQILEKVIHEEAGYPTTPIFVVQPVLRSQFLGRDAVETHTSFHNPTTVDINVSFEGHIEHIRRWLGYLDSAGFERENLCLQIKETSSTMGSIKYPKIAVLIYYGGLEVGDAVYIPSMPQKTRPPFSISDIGFGLERLQHDPNRINTIENDCLKTLALLAVSGVEPANKGHGYRFRLFSKEFVSRCGLDFTKMLHELSSRAERYIGLWSNSTGTTNVDKKYLLRKIRVECERNFNRAILNYLKEKFNYSRDVEINQSTKNMLIQLMKIGDKPKEFWHAFLKDINFNEPI